MHVKSTGLCTGHYHQQYRGQTLRLLRTDVALRGCLGPDCDRPVFAHGYCSAHIQQVNAGKPLAPLVRTWKRGQGNIRDDLGRKCCYRCKRWQPEDAFYPERSTSDGLAVYCRECHRIMKLLRNYGLTIEQYDAMLVGQGGGCAICDEPPIDGKPMHVDHDHRCCPGVRTCGRCIRQLLCAGCNKAIGYFADSSERAHAAAQYLDKWS